MSVALNLLLAAGWIGGTIALVLMVHEATRRLIPPPARAAGADPPADGHDYRLATRDAAAGIGFRVAALYGVLLALVYSQQLGEYQAVRQGLTREAAAISDVYADAGRYGGAARPVREAVREYVRLVVEREWAVLGREHRLSNVTWDARDRAYLAALDLVPATPREQSLRERMVRRLSDVTELRHQRREYAVRDFGAVFWVPALVGLILVTASFFVFPPTREVRLMLAAFGAFSGVILFFIQAFGSPFAYPLRYEPGPLQRLLETDMGQVEQAAVRTR